MSASRRVLERSTPCITSPSTCIYGGSKEDEGKSLGMAEERYKPQFDKSVRALPTFELGKYIGIEELHCVFGHSHLFINTVATFMCSSRSSLTTIKDLSLL